MKKCLLYPKEDCIPDESCEGCEEVTKMEAEQETINAEYLCQQEQAQAEAEEEARQEAEAAEENDEGWGYDY